MGASSKTEAGTAIALIAGVTMVVGGDAASAEIIEQDRNFLLSASSQEGMTGDIDDDETLEFDLFDESQGQLTGVTFDLTSFIASFENEGGEISEVVATASIGGENIFQTFGDGEFNDTFEVAPTEFSDFVGTGEFSVDLNLQAFFFASPEDIGASGSVLWEANEGDRLRLTYEFEAAAVPVPGTLPLVGIGLAGFGILGWRGRRSS